MAYSLAHVRPLSFGEILDGAFTLYRRHFSAFFGAALLPQLPVAAVWLLFLLVMALASPSEETLPLVYMGFAVLAWPFSLVGGVLPLAVLTRLTGDAYLGNEVSRANGFRWGWKRFWAVLLAMILYGLAVMVGFVLLIIPGFIVIAVFFAVIPVVVLEQKGVDEAVGRSQALASGAWLRILGIMSVLFLITFIPMMGIQALTYGALAVMAPGIFGPMVGQALANVIAVFLGALLTPITVAGTTLLYYDRRIRVEAFGLDPEGNLPMAMA